MSVKGTITFVTGNERKLREVQHILGRAVDVRSQAVDLPELQGEPDAIARDKCRLATLEVDGPVMVDDTSLCYTALGGMPGPYIKHFLDKTSLATLYNILANYDDKSAHAVACIAYCEGPGKPVYTFTGRTPGKIVPTRGYRPFGWDPIFQPDGFSQTYAEMEPKVKNAISHRGRALDQLLAHLCSHPPPAAPCNQ